MKSRKNERYGFFGKVIWDFFAQKGGKKSGYLANISQSGCLLKTSEPIDTRRWIRLIIRDESSNLYFTSIGRVVRRENAAEIMEDEHGAECVLYRYGIEFTHPNYFSVAQTDLMSALSSKNFKVRSCRSLNSKSPFFAGFLA